MLIDRNSVSVFLLIVCAGITTYFLASECLNDKCTYSTVGMIIIFLYAINNPKFDVPLREPPTNLRMGDSMDEEIIIEPVLPQRPATPSLLNRALQFCTNIFCSAFFTTDLLLLYDRFDGDINYIPLLAALLAIIPAAYVGAGKRRTELFIFTLPANCWVQMYLVGWQHSNYYAIVAGYFFFAAYYYMEIKRENFGVNPVAQSNYYLSAYCLLATLAITQATNEKAQQTQPP